MTAPGSFKPTCTSFCYGNVRYFCSIWKLKKVMKTSIKKYKYKQRLAQEIELVCIGQLYNNHAQILTSSHRADFYQILWFQKGHPTHLVDFNPVQIKPNTILFLNKNTVQQFDKNDDFDGKAILFTENFFCKTETDIKYLRSSILFNDLFSISQIQINKTTSPFANLLKLMEKELENEKDIAQSDILRNLLHNFLLLSEREKRKQGSIEIKKGQDLDYVIIFKDLLESNYRTLKQVSGYAKKMSITEKRLNQATSKIFDKSPKQMIDERLVLEAKRLLAHTNQSVKEIGFDLGFDEPTNFIKIFRKQSGSTPGDFREQFASV